jgi:hypothetical protein
MHGNGEGSEGSSHLTRHTRPLCEWARVPGVQEPEARDGDVVRRRDVHRERVREVVLRAARPELVLEVVDRGLLRLRLALRGVRCGAVFEVLARGAKVVELGAGDAGRGLSG